ncbi:MAG: DUF1553 domain-containing protein [Planctomycetota bacterium]|nr:DUF1553 domain-containing protein [Planctomycetota bacterium]
MARGRMWTKIAGAGVLALTAVALMGGPTVADDETRPETGEAKMSQQDLGKLIDAAIGIQQRMSKLEPAPVINDEGFFRRASLDIRGVPPTAAEVLAFVADKNTDKREKRVIALLQDEGYAEHWSEIWNRALVGRSNTARRFVGQRFEAWMEEQLQLNKPYNQLVTDIITAEGWVDENGATAYALRFEVNPMEMAAYTSRHFMGVQIECAQCHDHPYTQHKQKDFLGMAGYFGRAPRARERTMGGKRRFGVRERARGVLKVNASNDPVKPREWGRSVSPEFIVKGVEKAPLKGGFRKAYAKQITDPSNKFFSRMAVNRVWSVLFGAGLVNPVEDLEQGETLHPELLESLGEAFEESGYDLKWLIGGIVMSNTYQRDSKRSAEQEDPADIAKKALEGKDEDAMELAAQRSMLERRLFARAELRPLSPEQLFRSVMASSGIEEIGAVRRRKGFRLKKRQILQQFLFTFDNGMEGQVEDFSGTIPQALLMMNSAFVNKTIELEVGRVGSILKNYSNPKARIQRIFLHTVCRLPDKAELKEYVKYVKAHKNNKIAYQDVAWVLLNSSEFLFNN